VEVVMGNENNDLLAALLRKKADTGPQRDAELLLEAAKALEHDYRQIEAAKTSARELVIGDLTERILRRPRASETEPLVRSLKMLLDKP
jgi:hypothetical protein